MLLKHLQNSKASGTGVKAKQLWQQFSMPDHRLPSQAEKANHPQRDKMTPKLKLTLRTGDFDLLPIQEEARMLDVTFLVPYYFAFMVLNI